MRALLCFILFGALTCPLAAQNLVLNPGFEEFTDTSVMRFTELNPHYGACHMAMNLDNVAHWMPASDGTPDVIYLKDAQHAHGGRGVGRALVSGVHLEYLQGMLRRQLQQGEQVFVQMWVSLEFPSSIVPGQLAICFHENEYREFGTGVLSGIPDIAWSEQQLPGQHDTWTLLTGTFTAKGGEQYITIGNYKPLRATKTVRLLPGEVEALVRFDDVSVIPLRPPVADSVSEGGAEIAAAVAFAPEDVFFQTGDTAILPEHQNTLYKLVRWMLGNELRILIEGHTDAIGTPAANLELSRQRAGTVRDFLIKGGISKERIEINGLGEAHPCAENNTEKGRAQNRRVVVTLL